MSEPTRAVFLSYASQDAQAVSRIRDALEAVGVAVWFDQEQLKGGDAWDAAIRRRIKDCALFVPVVSAATNARDEGYFRLEWKLAVDRSNLIAADRAFLLPVTFDGSLQATARVPERFLEVQWSSVAGAEDLDAFAQRVKRLLDGSVGPEEPAHLRLALAGSDRTCGPGVRLERCENLPRPSRGLGFLAFGILSVFLGVLVALVLVTATVPDLPYRLLSQDIGDARRIAARLLDSPEGNIPAARKLVSIEGRERIAALLTTDPSSANDWQLRRTLCGEFNRIIKGDVHLGDGQETQAVRRAMSNRKALEEMFPEHLSVLLKPRGQGEVLMDLVEVAVGDLRHGSGRDQLVSGLFVLSLLYSVGAVAWFWTRQRPASTRFTFRDVKGVDELLEFLVTELGWRRPTRRGKALHFRPTLKTFLTWNVLKLTAWVDGTSVTVTGPEIFVRRLTSTLTAHAHGSEVTETPDG